MAKVRSGTKIADADVCEISRDCQPLASTLYDSVKDLIAVIGSVASAGAR
jgi:hypothetical protein